MVVNGHMILLFNLVHEDMSWSEQFLQKQGRDGHVCLSDAHFNLQLADDVVGYCHDLLEHLDLLFVADHGDLCGFEEEVR